MAWKTLKVRMEGAGRCIQHNGQLADPLNKFTKAIKEISGKRQKTDADFEQMAKLEFLGGLYLDANGPCWPGDVIEGSVVNGAKKRKEGPKAKSGLIVTKPSSLIYDGPRDPEELLKDDNFRCAALVRIGQSKVVRTRPCFNQWSCVVEVEYEDGIANKSMVVAWFEIAGQQVGVGDWRPRYGRFSAKLVD